jgi:hypothetical protein
MVAAENPMMAADTANRRLLHQAAHDTRSGGAYQLRRFACLDKRS